MTAHAVGRALYKYTHATAADRFWALVFNIQSELAEFDPETRNELLATARMADAEMIPATVLENERAVLECD